MELSISAKDELRSVLYKQFKDCASRFTDDQINKFGLRLLQLTAIVLKKKRLMKDDIVNYNEIMSPYLKLSLAGNL